MTCAPLFSADGSRSRRPAPNTAAERLARLRRHLALWVLQSWLAMFYIGAGYAKLTQPHDILSLLMTWPARTTLDLVHALGWIEIGLAVGLLTPLISWPRFRLVMIVAAGGLLADASSMLWYHMLEGHGFLAAVNGTLAIMALIVVLGRSRSLVAQIPA